MEGLVLECFAPYISRLFALCCMFSFCIQYNLCYSTLVTPSEVKKLDPSLYQMSENGNVFVHSHVKKGILPVILEELLKARKQATKDMKNAPTDFERAV